MRGSMRPATILFLLLAVVLTVSAESAKSFYDKGKDAEARQNYEAAYDFFKQAYDLKPQDIKYRAAFERNKFLAGASHVHRGQIMRDAGKLQEALAEFQKATEIDPSNFSAEQELRRTRMMIEAKSGGPQSSLSPTE